MNKSNGFGKAKNRLEPFDKNTVPTTPELPRIYSETAITVSTAIGGPLAGVYLISKNFNRLGFKERSKKWMYYGILGTIVFFVLILTIPKQFTNSIPDQIWQIAVAGLMYYLVVKYQQEYIRSHFDNSGPKASVWGAVGYGVLTGLFSLLVIFGYSLLFSLLQPEMEGKLMIVGKKKHEVYYSDTVQKSEAKQISDALIEMGFLNGKFQHYLKIDKDKGQLQILLPIKKKYWKEKEVIEALRHLKSFVFERTGNEVKILIFEDSSKGREIKVISKI